jgi:hypothetical protein
MRRDDDGKFRSDQFSQLNGDGFVEVVRVASEILDLIIGTAGSVEFKA